MKKLIKGLFIFSSLFVFTSCKQNKNEEKTENTITIKDMQNRELTIDKTKTNRVICLGAGALRYYSYIGDLNKIVAVEEIDKTPFGVGTALRPYYHANKDYFATLETCGKGGPAAQTADTEAILKNRPEIIISFLSAEANETLQNTTNIPVVGLKQGTDGVFDELTHQSFTLLGKIFNKEERASTLINYINTAKTELLSLKESDVTCYAGCIGNWGKTNLYGTYGDFPIFKYAKVKDSTDLLQNKVANKQFSTNAEDLLKLNPNKIFIDGAGYAQFKEAYNQDSTTFDALDAIKNGEVYHLLPYNAYYTNLEIQLMSTYYVASLTHESLKDLNMENKGNEILNAFLGESFYKEMLQYSIGSLGYSKLNLKD